MQYMSAGFNPGIPSFTGIMGFLRSVDGDVYCTVANFQSDLEAQVAVLTLKLKKTNKKHNCLTFLIILFPSFSISGVHLTLEGNPPHRLSIPEPVWAVPLFTLPLTPPPPLHHFLITLVCC